MAMDVDTGTLIAVLTGVAGVAGGWMGGRRNASVAAETVQMLTTQIEALQRECQKIPLLLERIAVLEELVTQKAEVEAVKQIVIRIEEKLNERA